MLTILKEYWHYATAQMALALVWRDFEQARTQGLRVLGGDLEKGCLLTTKAKDDP
jgi:hypothetical protein